MSAFRASNSVVMVSERAIAAGVSVRDSVIHGCYRADGVDKPAPCGHIRGIYAIESVNARIRRAVKARGNFANEAAALKCVCVAVMSLGPTGTGRKRWMMRWKAALNAFDAAFDGRPTTGRK